jgi:L-xylulokinase
MAEPGLLLGLDAGNTVIKAVLFDRIGRQLAASQRHGASLSPAPGHVERDMEELWTNAAVVIRECLEQAGVSPQSVAAVGCAGHGNGLYLLDRQDAPLLAIQSLDIRAARLAEKLRAGGNGARLHAICLQEPWPSQTPTLLAWVRRHAPEIYARCGTAFFCKDFIAFRLTGRKVSEISDMSGAGLIRLPAAAYNGDLLDGYGLADARDLLPELVGPTDIVGGVTAEAAAATGLAAGTPVVGGLFDVVASALGSGASAPGEASIIAGTWSINQVVAAEAIVDPGIFMVSAFAADRFMAIESSATSAANLEWYVRELVERGAHHEDPFGACNRRVTDVAPAADDPYFHPFLFGSREGAFMRAGFYGLAGWHGEGHLLRALFEGIAFEHRRHIDVLRNSGIRFDSATLSGGGARSEVWPQMFADVLGIPITIGDCAETGALGAAISAGVGAGVFPDFPAGVRAMTRNRAGFAPNPGMARHYGQRYRTFLMLTEAMKPLWLRMVSARDEPQYR